MATQNNFVRTFTVNTAMSAYIRVTVSPNGAVGPSGGEQGQGILQDDVQGLANGVESPAVRFYGTGSCQVAVTGNGTTAITCGCSLYTTANGYVCASPGTTLFGVALTASGTATGTVIEALPTF